MAVTKEARLFGERAVQALQSARLLLDSDPEGAASRAYYAAFYAVSALLACQGKLFKKHTAVQAALHQDLIKPGFIERRLGSAYNDLFEMRSVADYGRERRVEDAEAEKAVTAAAMILDAARKKDPELFPEPKNKSR
jgi:uncharacterized protein (UPF0332 family)